MPPRKPKLPNILFLGIDSLRADHMSCYGYPRLTTPHMDRFASAGHALRAHLQPAHPHHQRLRLHADRHGCVQHPGGRAAPQGPDAAGGQDAAGDPARGRLHHHLRRLPGQRRPRAASTTTSTSTPAGRPLEQGRMPKAENLNEVAIPELDRLTKQKQPFFLFLRHMDPHSPYLPPAPYERMFYHGNESDPKNKSMEPVMSFKPFRDYFASWMPPGITDKDYVIAQYDGADRLHGRLHPDHLHRAGGPGHPGRDHRRHQLRPRRDALRPRLLLRPSRPVRRHPARAADHPLPGQGAGRQARGRLQPAQGPGADAAWSWPGSNRASSSTAAACCRW